MADDTHDYHRLCGAVGSLILNFGDLENNVAAGLRLHLLFRLKKHRRADPLALAGAIYGSMRLKVSQNIMRRIMVEEGASPETVQLFDDVFAHVGHINGLRDKLAHQSVGRNPTKRNVWTVTDLITTRSVANVLEYEFSTDDVIAAAADLDTVQKLPRLFLPNPAQLPVDPPDELPTWQYKPSSLKLVRRKRERPAPTQ